MNFHRKLIRKFANLPTGSKILVGSLIFNISLMVGIGGLEYHRRKRVALSYQTALEDLDKPSDSSNPHPTESSSCYLNASLFHENCSYMTPDAINDDQTCKNLELSLKKCNEDLYQYITVDKTPAMIPLSGILNLPPWINPAPATLTHNQP